MKKLMITAAAVAMTAGAFAAPNVYDFKASVKHLYLKEVRLNRADIGFSGVVYQKYQKAASLKGYLIQDNDGLTSPTINAASTAACTDVGRNRSFLVVQNSKAESAVRAPKVLPAVLDAKYLDTKFSSANQATKGYAEGYLFVGGDMIAAVTPQLDVLNAATPLVSTERAAVTANEYAYSDYVWTSVYLFGQFNGPNWFHIAGPSVPFAGRESAWDGAFPAGLRRGIDATGGIDTDGDGTVDLWNFYHDTWMNGAGYGKYFVPSATTDGELCCGLAPQTTTYLPTLESLSGSLKGGLFLCTENGIAASGLGGTTYDFFDFDQHRWEDQFVAVRIVPGSAAIFAVPDGFQNDIWLDGSIDQATTDIIYGTWSIKFNRKFLARAGLYAQYQAAVLAGTTTLAPCASEVGSVVCAAAWAINRNVRMFTGNEIYATPATARFAVPFITPQFIAYYGL